MFCSKCGTEVEDGKQFCSNCGNSLLKQTTVVEKEASTSTESINDSKYKSVKKSTLIICAVAWFLSIIVVGCVSCGSGYDDGYNEGYSAGKAGIDMADIAGGILKFIFQ